MRRLYWMALPCLFLASSLLIVRFTLLRDKTTEWRRAVALTGYFWAGLAVSLLVQGYMQQRDYQEDLRLVNEDPSYQSKSSRDLLDQGLFRTPQGSIIGVGTAERQGLLK